MPAPFVQNIFQFEGLAAIAATVFNADSLLANICYASDPTARDLPKCRVDVVADNFAKASEQQIYADNRHWDSHFAGDFVVSLIQPRGDNANLALRATRIGRIRYLMSPKAQIFSSSNVPYWEILSLDHTGTRSYREDDDTDRTDLTFRVELAVLASAFP